MNAAQKLYTEYQEKLKQLQQSCPHDKLSDWMEEWWAPGHATDFEVRVCENCEEVVSRKTTCFECGKEIIDAEIHTGDGRIVPCAKYCELCYNVKRPSHE
jgi:hypothetical protein